MKLNEFRPGIESLNRAYNDVKDQLGTEDSVVSERVHDVLSLWGEALGKDYEFLTTYEESVLHGPGPINDHNEEVQQLGDDIRRLDSKNIAIWSRYPLNTLRNYVTEVATTARNEAGKFEDNGEAPDASKARNDYRAAQLLLTRIQQAELSHLLRMAVKTAGNAVTEAETAAENAKTAAGIASGSTLTERFEELSNDHLRTGRRFRWLMATGVIAGIMGTYVLAFASGASNGTGTTTGDAIIKVSLLGAVLGLATYFGRQAAYHRDIGTWARTIKVQLLTFEGYMEPLHDETLRDAMRASFAARVFGSSPESKEDSGVTLSSSFMSELLATVGKSGK